MRSIGKLGLLAAGLGIVLACGCRKTPKIDTRYNEVTPTPPPGSLQPLQPVAPGQEEWGVIGQKLPPRSGAGSGTIVPTRERWASVVVYFAYDSSAVGPAERPKLETLSQHLKQHPNYSVVVEGHCDDRGSDEYNRALGESRALAVRDYLTGLGIAPGRIDTVSYGEERPVVPNAANETQHQKNRRAEFIIGIRQ